MERELTMKQETFCSARAMGKSWADAYREAYAPDNPKARSVYTRASRMRNNPRIVQRIAELRGMGAKPLPDVGALYQQLLQKALELAEKGKDEKTRLGSLQWAGDILEKIRKLKEAARTEEEARKTEEAKTPAEDRAMVIAELRRLYAEALPKKVEGPIVESVAEETPAAGDGEEGELEAKSGAELLEDLLRPVDVEVPEQPAPQVRYVEKCISKPGHFPPKFARRLVSY